MIKKILFIVLLISIQSNAQIICEDTRGNLEFSSNSNHYFATLENDIFNDFTFIDSNKNKLTLNKEYVLKYYPNILKSKKIKTLFFKSLIREYKRVHNIRMSYEVDVFDKEIVKDLDTLEKTVNYTDIFDNEVYEISSHHTNEIFKKNKKGEIEYEYNSFEATLEIGFKNYWTYEDNTGNEFTFSPKAWKKLIKRFGDSEHVFFHLLHQYTDE